MSGRRDAISVSSTETLAFMFRPRLMCFPEIFLRKLKQQQQKFNDQCSTFISIETEPYPLLVALLLLTSGSHVHDKNRTFIFTYSLDNIMCILWCDDINPQKRKERMNERKQPVATNNIIFYFMSSLDMCKTFVSSFTLGSPSAINFKPCGNISLGIVLDDELVCCCFTCRDNNYRMSHKAIWNNQQQ